MENKIIKAFKKLNPNHISGQWNFWEIDGMSNLSPAIVVDGRFFTYEYQCGVGHDYSFYIGD